MAAEAGRSERSPADYRPDGGEPVRPRPPMCASVSAPLLSLSHVYSYTVQWNSVQYVLTVRTVQYSRCMCLVGCCVQPSWARTMRSSTRQHW